MKKILAGAGALAAAFIASPVVPAQAQGKTLTLCWAAWDPANALVELSKDFTAKTGVNMKFEFVPWTSYADRFLNELNTKSKLCDLLIGDSQWIGGSAENKHYVKLNEFFDKKKPDGRVFLILADSYFSYDQDSSSFTSNANEAFKAISCIDSRESDTSQDMETQNDLVKKTSKVFGRYWQYGGLACNEWPFDVVKGPSDYSAKGAPTILVIGTTNDPATPYAQAKNFANEVLEKGYLLTYDGEGHTAYGSTNSCISNTVDDFLIKGKLPKTEKTC
jgi:hypothetical protein